MDQSDNINLVRNDSATYECATNFHRIQRLASWKQLQMELRFRAASQPLPNANRPLPGTHDVRLTFWILPSERPQVSEVLPLQVN